MCNPTLGCEQNPILHRHPPPATLGPRQGRLRSCSKLWGTPPCECTIHTPPLPLTYGVALRLNTFLELKMKNQCSAVTTSRTRTQSTKGAIHAHSFNIVDSHIYRLNPPIRFRKQSITCYDILPSATPAATNCPRSHRVGGDKPQSRNAKLRSHRSPGG